MMLIWTLLIFEENLLESLTDVRTKMKNNQANTNCLDVTFFVFQIWKSCLVQLKQDLTVIYYN